jgi:NAD(P)H-nitrite reductase large subunit
MKIIIIGNGVSGVTAARWLRKMSDDDITIISFETDFFFSRTALMYIYMGHMRLEDTQPYENDFWRKNRIDLVNGYVKSLDRKAKMLDLEDGQTLHYDKLILAVGSKTNKYGWPGQDLDGVHGLYHLQNLHDMERHSVGLEHAVIVGGGLIGIEMAEMFSSRNIPVTFLVREESYWDLVLPKEESEMINQHILEHNIDLRLNTELGSIVDDGSGKACAVITTEGIEIKCGFVGITAGVSPKIDFLKDSGLELNRGILVNQFLQTNDPDIFAVGDCAEQSEPRPGRRPIEAIWYTGRIMGEVVAHNVLGKQVSYDPGIWFNSAKFFDIEYQVYGTVPTSYGSDLDYIYWEEARRSIRIVYKKDSLHVVGFNLMGIRFRHEVCEKWIREKTLLSDVLKNLKLAFFDPEFCKMPTKGILQAYSTKFGEDITSEPRVSLNRVLSFLKS